MPGTPYAVEAAKNRKIKKKRIENGKILIRKKNNGDSDKGLGP